MFERDSQTNIVLAEVIDKVIVKLIFHGLSDRFAAVAWYFNNMDRHFNENQKKNTENLYLLTRHDS